MLNSRLRRRVLVGVLITTALGISFGVGYSTRPKVEIVGPKTVTVRVSGEPGTKVSVAFEIDGVPQDVPDQAEVPVEFTRTVQKLSCTVLRVAGPDQPIAVTVTGDGIQSGTGTAAGGVRVYFHAGTNPSFHAAQSEPEWKQVDEAGVRPDLIGTQVPEWTPVEWINAKPLRLAELRGQVVLARWFTGPHCDDCSATAPALREFHDQYHGLGLAVIGMYFHADSTLEEVRGIVDGYGFRFPVGIDRGARTRRLWCQGRYDYHYTSATFLLDRQGVVRYIHPGGRYVKGDADYQMLESQIEQWLARLTG